LRTFVYGQAGEKFRPPGGNRGLNFRFDFGSIGAGDAVDQNLFLPAFPNTLRRDDANIACRRLYVRHKIFIWLLSLLVAIFTPTLFSGRVFASEPQRGDVVVFRVPKNDLVEYVKRIVGLPGDRVQMINGVLQINGQPVKHERIDDFVGDNGVRVKRYRETLPNGVVYTTLDLTDNGFYDNTPVYTVPPGHYFMLGDNLDNSTDSRVLSAVGYVPSENLIGRVGVIFFSIRPASDNAPQAIRYERIGTVVR
jgi:signal peptidase I